MTHRFFVDPGQIGGRSIRFDADQSHQIARVLRLRPGDRVIVLDGRGRQHRVALREVTAPLVTGQIESAQEATGEPAARLTLYQSLLKRDKFEWVLQKGTEVGVAVFVPVITRRSLPRETDDVSPERLARWNRIIKEAAEQAGRGLLPELRRPLGFEAALAETAALDVALLAHEGEGDGTIGGALRPGQGAAEVGLFIGPEGGFDPVEVDEARAAGLAIVTLGPRVLRTETAAVVAAALALNALGEMG
jgi:16S rRNA (uracil1498-N3)-methyltransferase